MNERFKPIGTIVKLINNDKLIMIAGYKFVNSNNCFIINDYIGIEYPNGLTDLNNKHLFNDEEIEKVIFMGYKKNAEPIKEKEIEQQLIEDEPKYLFDEHGYVINKDNNNDDEINLKGMSFENVDNFIKNDNNEKYIFNENGIVTKVNNNVESNDIKKENNSSTLKFNLDGSIIGY